MFFYYSGTTVGDNLKYKPVGTDGTLGTESLIGAGAPTAVPTGLGC